jgi:hypothetical protein
MANELKVTFGSAIPADCLLRSLPDPRLRVAIAGRDSAIAAVDGLEQRANEDSVYSAAAGSAQRNLRPAITAVALAARCLAPFTEPLP